MTDIRDRLDSLAASGVRGIELHDPSVGAGSARHRGRVLVAVLAAFLLVLGGVAWFAARDDTPVRTVDDTPPLPTTPTWPDPPADPVAPAALPRLVITAPGFEASAADESVFGDSPQDGAPSKARVWRRVDDPWSIIEVMSFPSEFGQADGTCPGLADPDTAVSEACDFTADVPFFEIGADGVVYDVLGMGVTAADIRAFVDDLDRDLFTTDLEQEVDPPPGWELAAAGTPGWEFDEQPSANIYFARPDGTAPELGLDAGTSLTAYDELIDTAMEGPDPVIRQVGPRVVVVAGGGEGRRAYWMEGDNVVAIFLAEGLSVAETFDAVASIEEDPATWEPLLAEMAACLSDDPPPTC
jgi:hypothetical protein